MTERELWNWGWEFSESVYSEDNLNTIPAAWTRVELPHDWLIYNTKDLYRDSIGWYRKTFTYQKDAMDWTVRFEAIYMNCTVFVNGREVKEWKYGYSSFDVRISDYLTEGKNDLMVRVIHQAPNSRWYSGAGIIRDVWMIRQPSTRIALDGVYISTKQNATDWEVFVDTEIELGLEKMDQVVCELFDDQGRIVTSGNQHFVENTTTVKQKLSVSNPKLWSVGQGNLYCLKVSLLFDKKEIDSHSQKIGFKSIRIDQNEGLFVNGEHVKIKGACEHHGFGCLGGVSNRSALKRKLEKLRKMGVNAIRTAHNMPSMVFMELADEMGFLVDHEAFDIWGRNKTTYDYACFFKEWMEQDVKSWIRRDRNHACILMWSLGNEIYDMHADEEGKKELEALIREVKKHDPRGNGIITFASNYMRWENTQKCADFVQAVGYNYGESMYEEHHKEHPNWVIYGSETAAMLGSRNIYHFPISSNILCEDDEQCSALGNSFAGWGAHGYLDNIIRDRDAKFSLGQFIWTGFDYFGEPTPYHTKNSYYGQVDTAGFEKDSYYIYQAEWTDYRKNPMVHVFPYWDFSQGELVDVCVCSNAPRVELFVNGKSLGMRELDHENGKDLVPHWTVPYEKGELYALAYDENGQVIATNTRTSFGDAKKLILHADKQEAAGDLGELFFVEISAIDCDGHFVENAKNRVCVQVTGAGRLIGIDNGDSTDFDEVKGISKRLFQGKLLAVVAPKYGDGGIVEIKVTSPGLEDSTLTLRVKGAVEREGFVENQSFACVAGGVGAQVVSAEEIPIRKLELFMEETVKQTLSSSGKRAFELTPEHKKVTVQCKIEPDNATYDDIIWKVVNDTGLEIELAKWNEKDEKISNGFHEIEVEARGDGEFYLRAIAMNGGTVASVRSSILFQAAGLGCATLNPYQRMKAGLFSARTEGMGEGVDHGIRFLGAKDYTAWYEHLDFLKCGTYKMALELFKYSAEPVHFTVFLVKSVMKEKDAKTIKSKSLEEDGRRTVLGEKESVEEILLEGEFSQNANWMEFKEEMYTLSKKLTGIQKIGIRSKDRFEMKSFWFESCNRALERIAATDYDDLFGDSYEICNQAVEKIGNNVVLLYKDLDFGDKKVTRFRICGKSKLEHNSIHVKIEKKDQTVLELIEFDGCEEYTDKTFDIQEVTGKVDVRFVFLPGSQFDLASFQFIVEE